MPNPPPQSPYFANYSGNPSSPKDTTGKLPGVPEQSNGEEPPKKEQRLIVVSNRLPVTISKDENGEYQFAMSSGGLVSALSGCKKKMSFTWIGWPGKHVSWHFPLDRSGRTDATDSRSRPGTSREEVARRVQLLPCPSSRRCCRAALQR